MEIHFFGRNIVLEYYERLSPNLELVHKINSWTWKELSDWKRDIKIPETTFDGIKKFIKSLGIETGNIYSEQDHKSYTIFSSELTTEGNLRIYLNKNIHFEEINKEYYEKKVKQDIENQKIKLREKAQLKSEIPYIKPFKEKKKSLIDRIFRSS